MHVAIAIEVRCQKVVGEERPWALIVISHGHHDVVLFGQESTQQELGHDS